MFYSRIREPSKSTNLYCLASEDALWCEMLISYHSRRVFETGLSKSFMGSGRGR
jgi:hypothetical protein